MAGHSKWKNIQHRKRRQDAKRGKIFTKISKEIFVAVKNGGDDPNTNTRLRLALQKARQNNMPNSNIETTIKKANGDITGIVYEEITYEGYGPNGVAVMVDCLTENRNRTAAVVRHAFSKHGGNLGESGCVAYLFERKGVMELSLEEQSLDEDTVLMEALEAGAEDVYIEDGIAEITTSSEELEQVKEALEALGRSLLRSEVTRVPATTIELEAEDAEKMLKLMEMLEDDDDVQNVYANFNIDDKVMENL